MENINTLHEALAWLRKLPFKIRKTKAEVRCGHRLTTAVYFSSKEKNFYARVFRTNGSVTQIRIEFSESEIYVFTESGKQKVRPLAE